MKVVKLKPATKGYIWGGHRLNAYGKFSDDPVLAESWELSFHKNGQCLVDSGEEKGRPLSEVVTKDDLGTNCDKYPFFPVLIKFIDAMNDLSIQVHPSDEYALEHENSFGKTEMWYVVEADDNSMLHIGFNRDVTKEEVVEKINNHTLLEIMNHITVKPGDCYMIPSGTIHSIGKGCLIVEIQENSDLTYRVYDFGRLGPDGKPRELHIEKSLEVLNFKKNNPINLKGPLLADNKYFKVEKLCNQKHIITNEKSFGCITFIDGEGTINGMTFKKGDSFFVPANTKVDIQDTINGNTLILTTIN